MMGRPGARYQIFLSWLEVLKRTQITLLRYLRTTQFFWNFGHPISEHPLLVLYSKVRFLTHRFTYNLRDVARIKSSQLSSHFRHLRYTFQAEWHRMSTEPIDPDNAKAQLQRNKTTLSVQKNRTDKKSNRRKSWWAANLFPRFHRPAKKRGRGRPPKKKTLSEKIRTRFNTRFGFLNPRSRRTKKVRHARLRHRYHFQLQLFASLFCLTTGLTGAGFAAYDFALRDLPPVTDLVERKQRVTTRILDRNGELLFRIYDDENRTLIKLTELPPYVTQATIAIEDKHFYLHHGFSIVGITRAFIANAKSESVQGGSTITQQLVKNRLLTPERTLKRKVRELLLALQVDKTYSKDQILEMYLNQVAYGGATYGIEEAAQMYFGKSATEISLAEAAMLAGLPQAPSVYSPFGNQPELAFVRQNEVLRRMVEDGYITQKEADAASQEQLVFRTNQIDLLAPHFVMYVRSLLAKEYGENRLSQDGLEVRTTLDLATQEKVDELVKAELESLQSLRVKNGSALVTDPATGEILAMVGSKDYFDFANEGQVNVTVRPRQPGSSIKPVTYALALSRGRTPNTLIDDSPITYQIAGSKPYTPRNYDGKYHGRVTLRESLASSYNIPAVKLLAELGLEPMIDLAEKMGITTWQDRSRFGLSLTLGGGEVLMTDMAEVYGTFANYGQRVPLNPILEIKDAHGELVYRNTCALEGVNCSQDRVLDSRVAYQITSILKDNQARSPAFGTQSVLAIPGQEVAVKTGTTNNLRDNWTFGYTTEYLVATWVGNNDNSPMSYVASGITGASPMWNKIMRTLLSEESPHTFPTPDGMISVAVCKQTGTLACTGCPTVVNELFIPGTQPKVACTAESFKPKTSPLPNLNLPPAARDQILDAWRSQ